MKLSSLWQGPRHFALAAHHTGTRPKNIPTCPSPKETSNPFGAMDKRRAQTVLVSMEQHAAAFHGALRILMFLSGQTSS